MNATLEPMTRTDALLTPEENQTLGALLRKLACVPGKVLFEDSDSRFQIQSRPKVEWVDMSQDTPEARRIKGLMEQSVEEGEWETFDVDLDDDD